MSSTTEMANIHETAIICEGAEIHPSAEIGAYAYIGGNVKIGPETRVHHHATVDGQTQLGSGNEVYSYAYIGGMTHDLKYKGGIPGLKVGDRNVFREYVTVHIATEEGNNTVIGNDNHFLAYSHVAHDCILGNHIVMSASSALAGHVEVGDYVNIGWNAGVHQHCSVGEHAMLGACSKIVQAVFPYMLADGNPASVRTINKVGMERRGFDKEAIEKVRHIYNVLYRSGLNRTQALEALESECGKNDPYTGKVLAFAQASARGLI